MECFMDASQRGGWVPYSSPQLLTQLQAANRQQLPPPTTASSPVLALSSAIFSSTAQILCPTLPAASMHLDASPHPRRDLAASSIRSQGQEKHTEALSARRTTIAQIEEVVHKWMMQLFTRDPELSLDSVKEQLRAHCVTIDDIVTHKLPDLEKQSPLRATGPLASKSFAKVQKLYQRCSLIRHDIDLLRRVAESPHYKEVQNKCAEWRSICTTIETFKNLRAIVTIAAKFFADQEKALDEARFNRELVALIRWQISDMRQLFLHHIKRFTATDKTRALIQIPCPQDTSSVDSLVGAVAALSLASSVTSSAATTTSITSAAACAAAALPGASASLPTPSLSAPSSSSPKEQYVKRFSTICLDNPYKYKQGDGVPRVGYYFWLGPNTVVWQMEEVAKGLQMLNQDLLRLLQSPNLVSSNLVSSSSQTPTRDANPKVSDQIVLYKDLCTDSEEKLKQLLDAVDYTAEFAEIQKYAGQLRLHIRNIRQKIACIEHAFDSWDLDDTYAFFSELHAFLTAEKETDRLKALYKLIRLEEKLSTKKHCSQTIQKLISYFGKPLVARKGNDDALLQAYITKAVSTKQSLTDDDKAFLLRSMIRLLYFAPEAQDERFYVALFALEKTRAFSASFSEDTDFKKILQFFKDMNAYSSLSDVFTLFTAACTLLYQLEEPVTESTRSIRQIVDMHRFFQFHQALTDIDAFLQRTQQEAARTEEEIGQKSAQVYSSEQQIQSSRERLARIHEEKSQVLSERYAKEPLLQRAQQRLAALTKELLELRQAASNMSLSTSVETAPVDLRDAAQLRLREETLQANTLQQRQKSTERQRADQEAGQLQRILELIETQLQEKIRAEEREREIIRANEQQMEVLRRDIDACNYRKRQRPPFIEHLYRGAYEKYAQFQYLPKSVNASVANLYNFFMQFLFSQDTRVQENARRQIEHAFQQYTLDRDDPVLQHLLRVFSLVEYLKKGSTACTPLQSHFLVRFLYEYMTNPSYFDAYRTLFDVENIERVLYQVFTNSTIWQSYGTDGTTDPKKAFQDMVTEARQAYLDSWKSLMSVYDTFMDTIRVNDQDASLKKTQCEQLLERAKTLDLQGTAQFSQIHAACLKRMQQAFDEKFPIPQ